MSITTIQLPVLNEGETYAGLILNEDGRPSHHLILLTGDNERASHAQQIEWAKSIGGDLPTLREQSLLFANCEQHFNLDWYWSSEDYKTNHTYAWGQSFYGGLQSGYRKVSFNRARAVRRLVIE